MILMYVDTGAEVAIGDVVRYRDDFYRILSTKVAHKPRYLGRVTVKSISNPFEKEREIMPYEIGAEWRDIC